MSSTWSSFNLRLLLADRTCLMTEKHYINLCTDYQYSTNAVRKAETRLQIAKVILEGLKKGHKWAINANERDHYPSKITKYDSEIPKKGK